MPNTANGLPYPVLGGDNNPPADLQALAQGVDALYGLSVANPGALTGISAAFAGMRVWVVSLLAYATYNGSAWTWPTVSRTPATSGSSSTSGTGELTLVTSATLTFDGVTEHEIAFSAYNIALSTPADSFQVRVYLDTTALGAWNVSGAAAGAFPRGFVVPTAGIHNVKATLIRAAGSGTASMSAASGAPAHLTVRPTKS